MSPIGRVIFNADDLGFSPEVNAGVRIAHESGLLRSASMLTTGAAFSDAVALVHTLPGLSVGVHLALVHERPASPPATIPSLVGSEGLLIGGHGLFTRRWLARTIRLAEVERELRAQILLALEVGLSPTHLDSHQHLHLLPGIFALCLQLCEEFGIPFIRLPQHGLLAIGGAAPSLTRRLAFAALRPLIKQDQRLCQHRRVKHCDGVWGMLEAGRQTSAGAAKLLARLGPGLHEFMCHPGKGSSAAYTRYDWGYDWDGDLASVTSTEVREVLEQASLQVTDFRTEARRVTSPEQVNQPVPPASV